MTDQDPTTFDDVDVDEDISRYGEAPDGDSLTEAEAADIQQQLDSLPVRAGVDPEEVN